MVKSMTGFGRESLMWNRKKISVEIKCVNSKNLDISCKWNGGYRELENVVRIAIAEKLQRGKIDCVVCIKDDNSEDICTMLQADLLAKYTSQLKEMALSLGQNTENVFSALLQRNEFWKNPLQEETDYADGELKEAEIVFRKLLSSALDQTDNFRIQEGEALKKDILLHVVSIEEKLSQVVEYESLRIENIRARLCKTLSELENKYLDNKERAGRFEEEMIYYLEKWDITEEKIRLAKHCQYFKESIDGDGGGKKLGFISQEMGREINTLGSKANEINMQKLVVEMKDELEKIKEQLFNIL